MNFMTPYLKTFIAAVCLSTTAANAQETLNVPIDQAGAVATQALFAGDTALAVQIAQAVLQQRPDDRASLLVIAVAAPRMGDPAAGRKAGARAYAVSTTDAQKYEAARLTALAAANEERFTLATFWLRRALNVAPNAEERARTISDARGVQRQNPWSTSLSFSLVPSNNVNGGAESADSSAPGNPTGGTLSDDALALEGWRASWGLTTSYRIQENARNRTTIGLSYQGSHVWLTDSPDIPDEAFDTLSASVNVTYTRALENGTFTVRATRGVYEFRDLDLDDDPELTTVTFDKYDTQRLQFDRRLSWDDRTLLNFSVSREWLDYLSSGIGDVTRTTVGAGVTRGRENGDRYGVNISFVDSVGEDNTNYTSDTQTIRWNYRWAEPVLDMTIGADAGVRWANYPDYRLFFPVTGGRQDFTYFTGVDIGLPNLEYGGFSPGLRLDRSVTDSNVSRFDKTSWSVGLTINSTF